LRVTVLGSGSSGNSTLLCKDDHVILIDAGFSCRELERRIKKTGNDPQGVSAIVISHEHVDHLRGAEAFSRRYSIPVYISDGTAEAMNVNTRRYWGVEMFCVGREFEANGFSIKPFTIAHDAVDPSAFVISNNGISIGIGTDLGYVTKLVESKFEGLDLLILESNYEPEMLMNGPYPWFLKQRISSRNGHLSNPEMSEFVASHIDKNTRHLLLAHLSRTNNNPVLALQTCMAALTESGNNITKVNVTNQFLCSETIDLEVE
jgi:phosphoribosyl 1,2-cyclic phosphodiesterase